MATSSMLQPVSTQPAPQPISPPTGGKKTVEEFAQSVKAKYPQYKNIPDAELTAKMLEKYPQYSDRVDTASAVATTQSALAPVESPKKDGLLDRGIDLVKKTAKNVIKNPALLLTNPIAAIATSVGQEPQAQEAAKSVVKGIAAPFVRAGVTGAAAVQDTANLMAGNKDAVSRTAEGYNIPGFGNVKPHKIGTDIEIKKDAVTGKDSVAGGGLGRETLKTIGTGAEIGSLLGGGGAAENIGAQATKRVVGEAALAGGFGNLGMKLQEDDVNALDAAGAFAVGSALGAGTSALAKEGPNIWRTLRTRAVPAVEEGAAKVAGKEISQVGSKLLQDAEDGLRIPTYEFKAAERVGISPRDLSIVEGASDIDVNKMRKMVSAAEEAAKSPLAKQKPVEIAGDSVMERVNHVVEKRKEVGKALDQAVKAMPKDPIDVNDIRQQFLSALEGDGVRVLDDQEAMAHLLAPDLMQEGGAKKAIQGKLDFSEARYANDKSSQKLIQQVFDDLETSNGQLTPEKIRRIRQRLFDDLDLGKKQEAMSDRVRSLLEGVRGELDKPLQALSDDYAKYAREYAESSTALSDFYDLLGKKFTGADDKTLALRAGEVGNRLLGNASANTLRVLDQLEGVAKQLGFEGKDNVARLFHFSDLLDDVFGITAKRGFEGGVQRGVDNALEGASIAGDVVTGKFASAGGKILKRVLKVTPEEKQAAIKRLLGM